MGKHSITVELDDETVQSLAVLGEPSDVLAHLASSAAQDRSRSGKLRRNPGAFLVNEREATDNNLIGERARADDALADLRAANERLVVTSIGAHESADVAEEAKQRAEASERELRLVAEFRELFIGIVGHDLRNPLGSIVMSAAGMLRAGRLATRDQEAASRIIRASQRMTRLIAQLLDLTRARLGGGLTIEPMPTDLDEICRSVVEEFDAKIELDLQGDLNGTWDHDRLAQVISNISGNAIEHAAPGTAVSVKAHGEGPEVVVEIQNRGEPIPANVLPFIFEPFRRAKEGHKSPTGNLGLGLYIAKQIVLSHGGTLDAHSAGGTTTFEMRLPRHAPPPRSR